VTQPHQNCPYPQHFPDIPKYFFINPAVSEANMVDTYKHFEIGSHLSVFVIEHLCRTEGATNTKQIK
jgi:hypothetical protein